MARVSEESFVRVTYPFQFDVDSFDSVCERISSAKCGSLGEVWNGVDFPRDELLPHIASYLNADQDGPVSAKLWSMAPTVLNSVSGLGGGVHGADWKLAITNRPEVPFVVEDVEVMLFRVGTGLLTLRLRPKSFAPAEWLDFLHHVRYQKRKDVRIIAERQLGDHPQGETAATEIFRPPLVGECGSLGQITDGLLRTGTDGDDAEDWWNDVFIANQCLPFAVLYLDDVEESQDAHMLYKVRNFFHAGQGDNPSQLELRQDQEHLLPYAERQWFVFSLDGGAFVAFDAPRNDFFRATLPDHLDKHYLLAYLIALHQRFALVGFSGEIARQWTTQRSPSSQTDLEERERIFRGVRDMMLTFSARGYFNQIMQRRHHHEFYSRWQQVFQVDRWFDRVNDALRDMHTYLLMSKTEHIEDLTEHTRRLERRLNLMVAVFAPAALVLALIEASGGATWTASTLAMLTSLALAIAVILLWAPFGKDKAKAKSKREEK